MAYRCSAFLSRSERFRVLRNPLFLLSLELFLTLGLEFPLDLFEADGQFLDLVVLGRVLFPQGVELSMERPGSFGLLVSSVDEET